MNVVEEKNCIPSSYGRLRCLLRLSVANRSSWNHFRLELPEIKETIHCWISFLFFFRTHITQTFLLRGRLFHFEIRVIFNMLSLSRVATSQILQKRCLNQKRSTGISRLLWGFIREGILRLTDCANQSSKPSSVII